MATVLFAFIIGFALPRVALADMIACFSASPEYGPPPLTVQFTDCSHSYWTSTGASIDIASWSWSFGDGSTSIEQNPSHTYVQTGTYTVTLTATNVLGYFNTTQSSINVYDNAPPARPALNSPADDATDVSSTPTLQAGGFSDSDNDAHIQSQWQISTDQDFTAIVLDLTSYSRLTSLDVPSHALLEGTTYYWRVRFKDSAGNWSAWSEIYSFTVTTTTTDQDGDGIPDNLAVDNTVDLDNDGTADNQQNDMKSLNTVVGGQMGMSRKNSPTVTAIDSIGSIDPAEISQSARPYSMPLGLFSARLTVANPGDTAEVDVYFSQAASSAAKWYRYCSSGGWKDYSGYATFSADRKSATLRFQDGGFGDGDGTQNGVIVDPGGFGLASWINGIVYDSATNQRIPYAQVIISELNLHCALNGQYSGMLLPGTYTCTARAPGYQSAITGSVEVQEGEIETQNFYLTPRPGVTLTGLDNNLTGLPSAGESVTFTANGAVDGEASAYYRFDLIPNYGTDSYDPANNWQTIQDFSTDSSCTYSFAQEGSYVVVVWASDSESIPTVNDPPIIGGSLTVGGEGDTAITGLDMNITGTPQAGDSVTFTASATNSSDGDIYYRFDLIPNYGTSSYDPNNNYQTIRNFSTGSNCTHTFTESGSYIIVVWASSTASIPTNTAPPIIGGSITVE
jgi:PKD repeat protein